MLVARKWPTVRVVRPPGRLVAFEPRAVPLFGVVLVAEDDGMTADERERISLVAIRARTAGIAHPQCSKAVFEQLFPITLDGHESLSRSHHAEASSPPGHINLVEIKLTLQGPAFNLVWDDLQMLSSDGRALERVQQGHIARRKELP